MAAPERIWLDEPEGDGGWYAFDEAIGVNNTEYIRADLIPKWQPIETAPKDGTRILCILEGTHPYSGQPFCPAVVEWWKTHWRDPDDEFAVADGTFSHWMPLPPAPEDE